MIIGLAGYFDGAFSLRSTYFALMAFLIVAALFLSYEILYNQIIDRERVTTGMGYMLIHVFLIFAMNSLTLALEFMQEERVQLLPKVAYLVCAFLLYYGCLFALMRYARNRMGLCRRFLMPLAVIAISFVALMIVLREHMLANIAVSVHVCADLSVWKETAVRRILFLRFYYRFDNIHHWRNCRSQHMCDEVLKGDN